VAVAAVAYPVTEPYRRAQTRRPAARCARPRYALRRLGALACLLVVLLALRGAVALASSLGGGTPLTAPEAPIVRVASRVHVVQPGDTFWSIARSLEPAGDVREVVDRLIAVHGDATLEVGERVALP
jgi:hypothetical protein